MGKFRKNFVKNLAILVGIFGFYANLGANELKIGASIVPHSDILRFIAPKLENLGYKLKIVEINDGFILNQMVENGELDANFFQHEPYLAEFNRAKGTNLVKVASIHIEPMAVYSAKHKVFAPQKWAKITIPNNPTNEARALRIVENAGLIKLKSGDLVTPLDITENPLGLNFITLDDTLLTRSLADADFSVINSNFAIQAGLNPIKDGLFRESEFSGFANIIAVKNGNENSAKIKDLINALQSSEVREFLESYDGALIPAF